MTLANFKGTQRNAFVYVKYTSYSCDLYNVTCVDNTMCIMTTILFRCHPACSCYKRTSWISKLLETRLPIQPRKPHRCMDLMHVYKAKDGQRLYLATVFA